MLIDLTLPRTLDEWTRRFSAPQWRGTWLQGWLFEGVEARRAAERQLAAAGVHARLHCAYKPLVHFFLEEVEREALAGVTVRYPVPTTGSARRFLLEAYPLPALLPGCTVQFEPGDSSGTHYDVALRFRDGRTQTTRVFAPQHLHADASGTLQQSPTGWLRAGRQAGGADLLDTAATTELERLFTQALQTVQQHPWPAQEPYFERLDLRIDLPGFEQPLPGTTECMSSTEALHEDLYFALLEHFQRHSGRPPGDRRLQPGQIVPDIRTVDGPARLRIAAVPFDVARQDAAAWADAPDGTALPDLGRAPAPERIARQLDAWVGTRFEARSRQGRIVHGLYRTGTAAPVLLSAGQHANETSGVVGALRAAQALHAQADAHFALIALENPDGYALHRELCAQHPLHMQHAARYTALGDDVEYREAPPFFEREARQHALAMSGAQLHVNLHGYPAHEWTRPLSGYIPQGFEAWMLPKGFFLILRHHPGWQAQGRALLERVTRALQDVPGLMDFNARQRALYEQHAGPLPFEMLNGTICTQTETTRDAAVTLITEFPDETVDGDAFRFAHTVQTAAALAAIAAWQEIMAVHPAP